MQQKLVINEQQRNDAAALALQCRLGALPFSPKVRSLSRRFLLFPLVCFAVMAGFCAWWWWPSASPSFVAPVVAIDDDKDTTALPVAAAPILPEPELKAEEIEQPKEIAPAKTPFVRTVEIIVWPFANISLNGNPVAHDTKSVILKLEAGSYKLAFTHPYAATVEKIVKISEAGSPIEVRVSLDKSKPAFLVVHSNVDGDVAVDGNYRGTVKKSQALPIVIPMPDKTHAQKKEVIVSQDSYLPLVIETEFVAGQTKVINAKLKEADALKKLP
jgi:hypothetical protein